MFLLFMNYDLRGWNIDYFCMPSFLRRFGAFEKQETDRLFLEMRILSEDVIKDLKL